MTSVTRICVGLKRHRSSIQKDKGVLSNEDRYPHESNSQGRIEALHKGDQRAWSALFEPDAQLYDTGNRR